LSDLSRRRASPPGPFHARRGKTGQIAIASVYRRDWRRS